jgi:hypothetical protein
MTDPILRIPLSEAEAHRAELRTAKVLNDLDRAALMTLRCELDKLATDTEIERLRARSTSLARRTKRVKDDDCTHP